MKIDKVVVSSNNNEMYLGFWESISRIWKEKMGIDPILVLVSNKNVENISTKYGEVIYYPEIYPIGDERNITQTQCVRLFVASRFKNSNVLTSDIDMYPLSKNYFFNSVKNYNDDCYIEYSSDAYLKEKEFGYGTKAMCYNLASGNTFKEILNFENEEKEIKNWIFKYNNKWGSEEQGLADKINVWLKKSGSLERYKPLRRGFPLSIEPFSIRRICRSNGCQYNEEFLKRGYYYDLHSLRPYEQYKELIDKILKLNFGEQYE